MSETSGLPLWTGDALVNATGGTWLHAPDGELSPIRVSYDVTGRMTGQICVLVHRSTWGKNRRDPVGDIPRLVRQGAAALVLQQQHLNELAALGFEIPETMPVLLVADTYVALREMANAARDRFQGKVIALTGTVGKTTTREIMRHLAACQGGADATRGNNNNIPGVHRTLAYTPENDAAVIVEMGFGKPLQGIKRSSLVARPDVALITTIGAAHFDMFTDDMLEEADPKVLLCRYKGGIFEGLKADGAAVINGDIPEFQLLAEIAGKHCERVLSFGRSSHVDARITSVECFADHSVAAFEYQGKSVEFTLNLPGRHMVENAVGALVSVHAAGFDFKQAARDIASFQAVRGRARRLKASLPGDRKIEIIDDSFGATLMSMKSTIDLLDLAEPRGAGRRIAVVGEIAYVGRNEAAEHRDLAAYFSQSRANLFFSWGPLMRGMFDDLPSHLQGAHEDESVERLYAALISHLRDGDVITVKSGRGVNGLGDIKFRKFVDHLVKGAEELRL